jgi:hypothetical protein
MNAPQYYPNGVPIPQVANQQRQQSIINCAQKCMNSGKYKRNARNECIDDCTPRRGGYKRSRKNKSRKSRKSRKGKKSYKR